MSQRSPQPDPGLPASHDSGDAPSDIWAYRVLPGPVRDTLSRYRVVKRLAAIFDVVLGPLALVAVTLFIIELLLGLPSPWAGLVINLQLAIWGVFLFAFVVEISLAPRKLRYLRRNWMLVISLFLPAFRIFRVLQSLRFLRTARVARGVNVARSFTSVNRAMRATRNFLGFSQLAFLLVITAIVWLAAAGVVLFLEAGQGSGLDSISNALWWSAAVLTTVGIQQEPVTGEGRIIAIALRIFGVAIIGYFTARLAAFFLGGSRDPDRPQDKTDLSQLRDEIAALRADLRERGDLQSNREND